MANQVSKWQEEANKQAKKYADAIRQQNQQYIDQQSSARENALLALQNQNQSAITDLNANKETYKQTALDNAKQANINRLLALKSNQGAMNRAGLGTQGIVGSQVNSVNNSYGTNLNSILKQRDSSLQDVDKQIGQTNLAYDTQRLNIGNEYDTNIANLKRSIEDSAMNQYNTIYQQYLAQKQAEWERQQAELQRQEQIRQFNEQMAYQKVQDRTSNKSNNGVYGSFGEDSSSSSNIANIGNDIINKLKLLQGSENQHINRLLNSGTYAEEWVRQAVDQGKLSQSEAAKVLREAVKIKAKKR